MSDTPSEAEQLRRLEQSLRRTSVVRREILLAVLLDTKSYAEISEVTGLSVECIECIECIEQEFVAARHGINETLGPHRPAPWWRRFARRIAAALGR